MFQPTSRVTQVFLNSLNIWTNCYSISNFLTRPCFDKYMKQARGWSAGNSVLISLIDSVMAFGFHAFLKSTKRSMSPDEKRKAEYYSLTALNSYESVLCSPDTLLKLQVGQIFGSVRYINTNRPDNFSNGHLQTVL
jgi:hypothetical protein